MEIEIKYLFILVGILLIFVFYHLIGIEKKNNYILEDLNDTAYMLDDKLIEEAVKLRTLEIEIVKYNKKLKTEEFMYLQDMLNSNVPDFIGWSITALANVNNGKEFSKDILLSFIDKNKKELFGDYALQIKAIKAYKKLGGDVNNIDVSHIEKSNNELDKMQLKMIYNN